jgi:predicted DNA-binding antitoxin AbrB/MazE fold protein
MQVEAIYENGKLEFKQPLHLKNKKITVMVTLPDEAIEKNAAYNLPPEVIERARALLQRMEAIKNAPLPPDDELPELTEKQLERIEAFALRDEIKGLR